MIDTKMTALRFALSLSLLFGMVFSATASEIPDLRSPSSGTTFLEERAEKGTCRVHIQEIFTDGKKNLHVNDIASYSRSECKSEALLRKIASEGKEDIREVKVYFSYREPAILN